MTNKFVPVEKLRAFAVSVLRKAGTDVVSAEGSARALAHASLLGVDSHGFRLLPVYVEFLRTGLIKRTPAMNRQDPKPAVAIIDADGGLGHAPAYAAAAAACELARTNGIGLGLVKRTSHFGAAGAYAMAMAEAGFMGIAMCNSGALVALFDGTKPFHGTDPIAFAAPATNSVGAKHNPFLLDMATSSISWNRVSLAKTLGRQLPFDVAMNQAGGFTLDPEAVTMLAPLGGREFGYKGAGLAGMIELLCAVLNGTRFGFELDTTVHADVDVGNVMIAISPGQSMSSEMATKRVGHYLQTLANHSTATKPVFAAGGPQWISRDERMAKGIPLPDALERELQSLARSMSIDWPPS